MASELSRLLPKRFRNPNPFKWLFGKFRRPSPHVSFDPPRPGLAAPAMNPSTPEHLQSVRAAVLAKAESLRAGSRPVLWVVCRWRLSYIYTAQAKSGGP